MRAPQRIQRREPLPDRAVSPERKGDAERRATRGGDGASAARARRLGNANLTLDARERDILARVTIVISVLVPNAAPQTRSD